MSAKDLCLDLTVKKDFEFATFYLCPVKIYTKHTFDRTAGLCGFEGERIDQREGREMWDLGLFHAISGVSGAAQSGIVSILCPQLHIL